MKYNKCVKNMTEKKIKPYNWYYPVMAISYIMTIVSRDIFRPGVISAVLLIINLLYIVYDLIRGEDRRLSTTTVYTEDAVMLLWFIYNVASGIWTVYYGIPFRVYLGELVTTALPMCFYYAGRKCCSRDVFYRNFLISLALIGLTGIIFYIWAPDFFVKYLFESGYISKADVATSRVRMYSVVGSTLMGYLSVAGMLISLYFISSSGGKRGRISFFFDCLLAFMSNQRAAMVAAILILVYVNFLVFFTFNLLDRKYFAMEAAAFMVLAVILFTVGRGALMKIYYRLISLPAAIAERSDQWVGAVNNMSSLWLGNGLGANGHRAAGYTEHMIADGGIAKLYCEMGVAGTSLFVFLLILVLRKGSAHLKENCAELGLIIITLLVSTGSNVMSFALSVPILYFAIGAVVSDVHKPSYPTGR